MNGELDDFICYGFGNSTTESHLSAGAQVVVEDGSKNILGVGRLEAGVPNRCNYTFVVRNLPEVAIYSLAVSTYPQLVFTLSELQGMNWAPLLALDVHGDLNSAARQ